MIKLVFLMVGIVGFGLLFLTPFSTLITSVINGGSLVFSSMSIFLDFFGKMFASMLSFAYINNILTIFLFVLIMFALVSVLRNGVLTMHDSDDFDSVTGINKLKKRRRNTKGKKLVIKGVKK